MRYFRLKALLPLPLLFTSCAKLPEIGELLGPLIGQHVSVTVPADLPLPDAFTLELAGAVDKSVINGMKLLSILGSESLEQRLGRMLKESAWPLRKAGGSAFKNELEKAKIFGSVVHEGGNLGMSLGVSRWGLAYNAGTKKLEPVLDLEAKLSAPGLGTVWRASRSAKDLGTALGAKMASVGIASLLAKPESFQNLMEASARELSRQLVDDLRKNPPSR